MNNWKLFIDDIRDPEEGGFFVTRNILETIRLIQSKGCPVFISFDHDLGGEETAFEVVKWLVDQDLDLNGSFFPNNFSFYVHSANPVGKINIESYLNNYLQFRGNNNE